MIILRPVDIFKKFKVFSVATKKKKYKMQRNSQHIKQSIKYFWSKLFTHLTNSDKDTAFKVMHQTSILSFLGFL